MILGIMKLSDTMATPIEEKLDQNLKVMQRFFIFMNVNLLKIKLLIF